MASVGTAEIKVGQKTQGHFRVGSDTDGTPFQIPVLIVAGTKPGPTAWVEGCVHGEEYGGAASIIRLYQELDPATMHGTAVFVPVTNLPSFKAHSRFSPLDGANLNRLFPGSTNGSYSQQLAHRLLEEIGKVADYVLDLHSGGIGAEVPFYAICKDDGSATGQRSMVLAERVGADVVWQSKGDIGGTITAHTILRGIPSVTVECGGGNFTEEHEQLFKEATRNFLRQVGILPGEAPVQDQYTIITQGVFTFSKEGGMFVPGCKVGDVLSKGDVIGQIINLYGEVTEELACPVDNGYIAAIQQRYYPTEPGDLVYEVMTVSARRGPSPVV